MKDIIAVALAYTAPVVLFAGAIYIISIKGDGWGWLLLVGCIVCPTKVSVGCDKEKDVQQVQEEKLSEKEAVPETILSEEDFIGYATGCCKACEADVAKYVCNDGLISARREGYLEDYWASCVNVNCEHHYGEGFGQQRLDWITIEETK